MAFNPIIALPLMLIPLALMVRFGKRLATLILKIKLPRILLAILVAIPLIVFEEHINCGAYQCTNVVFPPTLLFLIILEFVFFLVLKVLPLKKVVSQTVLYGFFGVFFECIVGSSHGQLQALAVTTPIIFAIIILWVALSYAFVVYLPLEVLNEHTQN